MLFRQVSLNCTELSFCVLMGIFSSFLATLFVRVTKTNNVQ